MTFTNVQNGASVTGTSSGGVTDITLTLPVASTAGTLLVACLVVGAANFPYKITSVGPGGNPNTSPGWEWCCTSVNGSGTGGQQVEIWCYRQNPGGITNTTWEVAGASLGCRGNMLEFSSTSAYQVMELFPGLNTAVTAGATSFPVSMGNPVGSGELGIAVFGDNFSTGTLVTWTTPSGWTVARNTGSQTIANHYASYYQIGVSGTVSVTGVASTATNQVGWEAALVVFREAASVRSRVGGSCSKGTYTDQSSFGFSSSKTGSAKEADVFVGRPMFQTAQVSYQKEAGGHLTGTPVLNGTGGDLVELSNMGAQICWTMRPRRNGFTGFTTVADEQAAVDQDLTYVKQSGINGFICTIYNEHNLGGSNGPFGNDVGGSDPYGNVGTGASGARAAQANWLAYWGHYQPTYAAHGIPVYTKPSYASPQSVTSWHPPAGTVSGVMADFYYSDSAGKTVYLDQSPGNDPGTGNVAPALTAVCDGTKNADNSSASNTPIPLGIGEWGRAGGSATPAWSLVVSWSVTHVRGLFASRLSGGKQNAPILWFENNLGGPNWIHLPGVNGEDETGICAELAACVDALAPQISGTTTVTVTTTSLPNAVLGAAYSQALQVSGGTSPYTWARTSGTLPTGLSLNTSTGVISGTPTVAGTYTFTVSATDAGSNVGNSGSLSIVVPSLSVTTSILAQASIGVPYTQTLTESGGTGPFTWAVTTGALPAGITLSTAGVLSGTTGAAPGLYGFTVTVTDSLANVSPPASLTLVVSAGASGGISGGGTPAVLPPGFPKLIVEAGFYAAAAVAAAGTLILDDPTFGTLDSALLGDATAWTDTTTFVRSGSINRASTRVQGPLRTYQAGTASVTLKNADGRFDPDNLTGPYVVGGVSGIRPMVPVRIRAVYGNVEYHLFSGFIDTWTTPDTNFGPQYAETTASATDGFKILAGVTIPAQTKTGAGEPSGNRIARILNAAGWYTDHRNIAAGESELQSTTFGDTALNLLQLAADTEIGELYIDGSGNVVFRQRRDILEDTRSTVPQAAFTDPPGYSALTVASQGFEGPSTGTWTGAGNCTIAGTGAAFRSGAASLQLTSAAAGNMMAAHCTAGTITTQGLPVSPGQVVPCSIWFLTAASSRSCQVGAQFYDSSGTAVGAVLYGPAVTDLTNMWVQATATPTVPAGAAYCRLAVRIQAAGGASEVHYADDAQLSYTGLAYQGVGRSNDDTTLANDVQITAANSSNMQEAQDASSIARYLFPRSYARTDVLLTSDAEALTYAQWVLDVSLAGEDRFDTLTVTPLRDPGLWPQVLGREIGDRITIIRDPPGMPPVTKDVFIRGISHTVDYSSFTWQTQWDLDDASRYSGFVVLNDPNSGQLSTSNKLAY